MTEDRGWTGYKRRGARYGVIVFGLSHRKGGAAITGLGRASRKVDLVKENPDFNFQHIEILKYLKDVQTEMRDELEIQVWSVGETSGLEIEMMELYFKPWGSMRFPME